MDKLFIQIKALVALKLTQEDSEPSEIIPNLYLGSIGAALSKKTLLRIGIKNIVTALDKMNKGPYEDICKYQFVMLHDSMEQKLSDAIE